MTWELATINRVILSRASLISGFPADRTERLKTADTPYQTDGEFEKAINETLPATGEELARLEKEYGEKYNDHIGEFLHIQQASRFELGFALPRLSQYNIAPKESRHSKG